MAHILLGVTGSVAAIKTTDLFTALISAGHKVKVIPTHAATYFFDVAAIAPLDPAVPSRNKEVVILDEDEWPGHAEGQRYRRDDAVLHIELRRWADLLVIAPLDANTLAKLAAGLADNCLTCVWRAWDLERPIVLAPAMNTLMWHHPYTRRHLREIAIEAGAAHIPGHLDELSIIKVINERSQSLTIVAPQEKRLACGDVGMGAMAEIEQILVSVQKALERRTNPT